MGILLSNYLNNKTDYVKQIIFIVCEATCFGPYRAIIRPSYESSQYMLRTCWDPNYVYNWYFLICLQMGHIKIRG